MPEHAPRRAEVARGLRRAMLAGPVRGLLGDSGAAALAYEARSIFSPIGLFTAGVYRVTGAAILGHKRASVLLDVYARALRGPKRDAAARLQALLYPPPPNPQPEPDESAPPG